MTIWAVIGFFLGLAAALWFAGPFDVPPAFRHPMPEVHAG